MSNNESSSINSYPFQVSWKKSLRVRFTLIFVIIQLLLGSAAMYGISYIYQARINAEYIERAATVSKLIAAMLDGEMIDRYLETLETDEEYERLLSIMKAAKENVGAEYIYVSRIVEDGEIFIFDTAGFELGVKAGWDYSEYDYGPHMDTIRRLIRGERVEPYITNTPEWGWLVTVYEPIHRIDGSVAAFVGIDISMNEIMQERANALMHVGLIILLIFSASVAVSIYAVQKYLISPVRMLVHDMAVYSPEKGKSSLKLHTKDELALLEHAMMNMQNRMSSIMTELKDVEELKEIMLDSYPLSCHIMNRRLEIIDCNEAAFKLFGLGSKQEYIEKFLNFMPEYQPDGRASIEKAGVFLENAFKEGNLNFQWLHILADGSPLPVEVTLVRVGVRNRADDFIAAYTKDLRIMEQMENKIHELEAEVDKIYYDALTGIYNRRFFDENLELTVKNMSRTENGLLSIMMIDIDKFKDYNDTYGHSEGDKCLKMVAKTIEQTMTRASDFTVRYGGEEFAVVMPGTDEKGARIVAAKILENIMQCNIPHEKNTAADCVTVSIGVAAGKADYTKPSEYYIKAADELLYKSKQNGRNQYTFGAF